MIFVKQLIIVILKLMKLFSQFSIIFFDLLHFHLNGLGKLCLMNEIISEVLLFMFCYFLIFHSLLMHNILWEGVDEKLDM